MKQRICKWEGCGTILTKYNKNPCCFAHIRKYIDLIDEEIDNLTCVLKRMKSQHKAKEKKIENRIKKLRNKLR